MIEVTFKQSMADAGLTTAEPVVADGKLHRIHVGGDKPGTKNVWYILFTDGVPSGAFGSWKTGIKGTWCAKAQSELSHAEKLEHKRRMDAARQAREIEEQATKQAAREKAAAIWQSAIPATESHPYLVKKDVKSHGLKIFKSALVIPVLDSGGTLHSLQFIDAEGNKRFLSGGRKKGCYFMIGQAQDVICIAEGYATGASIHDATGYAVAVAFDAGNLESAAQEIRAIFPTVKIVICADNDINSPENPGLSKATAAAIAVGGFIAHPPELRRADD